MNTIISTKDLGEIFATFITIFGTYFITKYQINNPKKTEIKKQQLLNLYLPLHRKIEDTHLESMTQDQLVKFIEEIGLIIDANYILVFPDLLEVYNDLKSQIRSHKDVASSYQTFINIIFYDYERLKRNLGYPSESYRDFFVRIDTPSKIKEVLSRISLLIIFLPMFYVIFTEKYSNFALLKSITLFLGSLSLTLKLNEFLTSIQRRK